MRKRSQRTTSRLTCRATRTRAWSPSGPCPVGSGPWKPSTRRAWESSTRRCCARSTRSRMPEEGWGTRVEASHTYLMSRTRSRRRLALAALLVAFGLAVAAFPFRATWWGGWILAVAEAGIVGGVADWFAVTALFRRPLGLPIPHTALIPANSELMAERLGVMVGSQVLTKDYVKREIWRFDVADLLARSAARVKPGDLETAVHAVARWAAGQLSPAATADLVGWLRRVLRARPLTPLLATTVEIVRRNGWDQRIIEAVAGAPPEALARPDFRDAVGDLLREVLVSYREKMGTYPRFLIGLADIFGLIDRDRLVVALHAALKKVAEDPSDPLRQRLGEMLAALPERL